MGVRREMRSHFLLIVFEYNSNAKDEANTVDEAFA